MKNNTIIPETPLPTLDRLGSSIPTDLDVKQVASAWFNALSLLVGGGDIQKLSSLFVADAFWRDILAFTWDIRTFSGLPNIAQFLTDRLALTRATSFKLRNDEYLKLLQPYPDLAWISFMFDFETDVGIGSGIARLVPTSDGDWKAHLVLTNLEDLKGYPEMIGPLRNHSPNHGKWEDDRKKEVEFSNSDPIVLVVGGGQSGLEIAARLKSLGISTLVVEKNPRIGDNWRSRYDALCLHDPVWYDHMPYMPFPPMWPVFTPACKLANWLEYYAEALELNVWTSATVMKASQHTTTSKWDVVVRRGDTERTLTVKHVIFATGLGNDSAKVPVYPGMDLFKGTILHSCQHKKATDHAGKKVLIIGACTSAHDIAVDYYEHGIDVTMFQRSSTHIMSTRNGFNVRMKGIYSEGAPPTEIADRINASFPNFMGIGLDQRATRAVAELDKDILDGLRKRGFKVNMGIHGTGPLLLAWSKGGGYYLDTGGSQLIADGKIKLKSGSEITEFGERGLRFADGSEIQADVVVFATGLGDPKNYIRRICGDNIADKCGPLWGLNDEGEIRGVWREFKVKGLWSIMGNLALCRFHSKHVALQIKAMEENVFGERYRLDE